MENLFRLCRLKKKIANLNYSTVDILPGVYRWIFKCSMAEAFAGKDIIAVIDVYWHDKKDIK